MGGGGSSFSWTTPERVRALVDQASQSADENAYQSEVNSILDEALSDFNDRDVERVRRHLDAIELAIKDLGEGTIELRYGGSVRFGSIRMWMG